MFEIPTYIVLEVPPPVSSRVHAIRERYDQKTAWLPVEITVAGSSGVGVLSPGQPPEQVYEIIRRVGQALLPIATSFVEITRFPGAPVFWLKPRNRDPFDALQSSLIAAGLQFESSPFAYTPHCTLSATPGLEAAREKQLLIEPFPTEEFQLARLSVYQAGQEGAVRLWTWSV